MLSYQELDQEAKLYGADIYILCKTANPPVAISNVPRWKKPQEKGGTSPTTRILKRLEAALQKVKFSNNDLPINGHTTNSKKINSKPRSE